MQEQLTATEWAWLAGLFEGEGNIYFHGKNCVRLTIRMTDRDVLETVDRLVPSPSGLEMTPRPKGWRTAYSWSRSARDDVGYVLEGIVPYLHERRGLKAAEALLRLKKNRGNRLEHNTHCKRGHLYTPDSIYTDPRGKQTCRICMRKLSNVRKKRFRARARDAIDARG